MAQNPQNFTSAPGHFMFRNRMFDLEDYFEGKSNEIMSLLNGVELELQSRRRLKIHNRRGFTENAKGYKDAIEEEAHEPEGKVTEGNTGKNYPGFENPDKYLNNMKSEMPLPEGKFYNNHNSDSSREQSPSLNDETQMQLNPETLKKTNPVQKNVDAKYWDDSSSYVDFSLSHPEVKWHKGRRDFIPKYSSPIGYTKLGKPLYAGRTWDEERSYLVPAFVDVEEGKCFYGKEEQLLSSNVYEIMECKFDAWDDAKGTPVTELSQFAYKAGYNEKDQPLYLGRAFIDGALTPGYIEERYLEGAPNNLAFALIIPFRGNVLCIYDTYEVMIVVPFDRL